jgi:nucleotide-binding universal stress UspA family protein
MTPALIATAIALGIAVVVLGRHGAREPGGGAQPMPTSAERILFPFAEHALSRRALDAALRLAIADRATLIPVFLARVPLQMPLDIPLLRQCADGMPLLETIEQRAAALGVPVDSRIERGRTLRHALREAIAHERYDRLVVAAASRRSQGFHGDDIAWVLDNAPGEVVIIRPDGDDRLDADTRTLVKDKLRLLNEKQEREPAGVR